MPYDYLEGPAPPPSRCALLFRSKLAKGVCCAAVIAVLVIAGVATGVVVSSHNDSSKTPASTSATGPSGQPLNTTPGGIATTSSVTSTSPADAASADSSTTGSSPASATVPATTSSAGSTPTAAPAVAPPPVVPVAANTTDLAPPPVADAPAFTADGQPPACVQHVDGYDRPSSLIATLPTYTLEQCYTTCFADATCAFFSMRSNIMNISSTDRIGCQLMTGGASTSLSQDLSSQLYDIRACKDPAFQPGTCLPTKPLNAAGPLADAYNRTLIEYNRWTDNTMCQYTPGLVEPYLGVTPQPLVLDLDIEIVNADFTCSACNGVPTCQIWHPDPKGNYQPYCSTTIDGSRFTLTTTWPGDEVALGWGYEIFTHVHYACCCGDSCVLNKFYFENNDFTGVDPRLVPATPGNVATHVGGAAWKYTIKIPAGGQRWWPVDSPTDIIHQRSVFGLSDTPQVWEPRPCCDPSSYPMGEGSA